MSRCFNPAAPFPYGEAYDDIIRAHTEQREIIDRAFQAMWHKCHPDHAGDPLPDAADESSCRDLWNAKAKGYHVRDYLESVIDALAEERGAAPEPPPVLVWDRLTLEADTAD